MNLIVHSGKSSGFVKIRLGIIENLRWMLLRSI
jgi:hypothetical protein